MEQKFSALLLIFILSLFVPACGSNRLVYKVTGSATEVQVEYKNARGEIETGTVTLPWEVSFDAGNRFNFEIKVENRNDYGSVTCAVWINDRLAGDATGARLAECAGSFSRSGNEESTGFQGRYDAAPVEAAIAPATVSPISAPAPPASTVILTPTLLPTFTASPTHTPQNTSTATPKPVTPTPTTSPTATLPVDLTQPVVKYAERPAWHKLLHWPNECETTFQATSLQKPDAYGGIDFYEVADNHYLVFVTCTLGPYWVENRLYLLDNRVSPSKVRRLAVPVLTQNSERVWELQEVTQIHGLPNFDPATRIMTNLEKYRGLGDCGVFYTYRFEQINFALEEARYHDCVDDLSEAVLSDQWEVIYPFP